MTRSIIDLAAALTLCAGCATQEHARPGTVAITAAGDVVLEGK